MTNGFYLVDLALFIYVVVMLIHACSKNKATDYYRAGFTLVFSVCFIYFYHVAQHKYNDSIFGKVHTMYHHNPKFKNELYSKLIEFINNIVLLIFILLNNLIKKAINVELFSNYILFMLTVYYLWSHFIEFHYLPSCRHEYHHSFDNEENANKSSHLKNYGPHFMDIIFNTDHFCTHAHVENTWLKYLSNILKLYVAYRVTIFIYKK